MLVGQEVYISISVFFNVGFGVAALEKQVSYFYTVSSSDTGVFSLSEVIFTKDPFNVLVNVVLPFWVTTGTYFGSSEVSSAFSVPRSGQVEPKMVPRFAGYSSIG